MARTSTRSTRSASAGHTAKDIDIEAILERRKLPNGRVQFLVKWEGFGDDENTWEGRANLVQDGHAREVRRFEAALKDAPATANEALRSCC